MASSPSEVLPVSYRRSELEASDCLYRYHAIYHLGVSDESDYSLRGIGWHAIKHRYIQLLLVAQTPMDADLARQAFAEGLARAKTPIRLFAELQAMWEAHTRRWELPLEQFVAAEEKQEAGDVNFTPDLVLAHPESNQLEIVDDKTYRVPLTETQAKQDFQARVYSRYAHAIWPHFASYRFTFSWVRYGTETSLVFSPADLDQLDQEIVAAIARIEQAKLDEAEGQPDPWPATAGPACAFCTLQCPIMDQPLIVPQRLASLQQATTVAAFVLVAEGLLRKAKKALKGYCTINGPVDVNGVVFDNRPIPQRSYPIPQVLAALRERELFGAFDTLTISHSALSALFKQFPELAEALLPVQAVKVTHRFGAKNERDEEESEESI